MNWSVEFTNRSRKQLKSLANPMQRRIVSFLTERAAMRENPRELASPIVGLDEEVWRFRVGDCRILVQFDDAVLIILVVGIGRRDKIYR